MSEHSRTAIHICAFLLSEFQMAEYQNHIVLITPPPTTPPNRSAPADGKVYTRRDATRRGVSQLSFIPTFKCVSAHGRAHTHIIRVVVVRSRQSKRYYDGGGGGMCGSVRDSNCVELVIIIIRLAQTERDAVRWRRCNDDGTAELMTLYLSSETICVASAVPP